MTVIIKWDTMSLRIEAPTVAEALETWRGLFADEPATTDKKVSARISNQTISTCSFSGELTRPSRPDGHRPWYGGICPVDPDTVVEVLTSTGCFCRDRASNFRWTHYTGSNYVNIVSYRKV